MLAVLMLASIGCAWAEGTAEEPVEEPVGITFQDIPWGSSREDVLAWLIQTGVVASEKSCYLGNGYDFTLLGNNGDWLMYQDRKPYKDVMKQLIPQEINVEFQIAGYSIKEMAFGFAYDGNTTKLIAVWFYPVYENDEAGREAIFADLQSKLRIVYGDGDIDDGERYLKLGENNTAVELRLRGMGYTELVYGVTNTLEILAECDSLAGEESITVDSTDTNGL